MPAASDRSRSVRRLPPASSTSPSRKSMPAGRTCRPGRAASVMVTPSPSATVSSWITTASAPSGITPPVKIRTASPAPIALVERPAGRDLADHLETRSGGRRIRRAHRIAVHRRHRLRRLGAQRRNVARQHAVKGRVQRDHFLGQRLGARENGCKRLGNRHQGHGVSPRSGRPDLAAGIVACLLTESARGGKRLGGMGAQKNRTLRPLLTSASSRRTVRPGAITAKPSRIPARSLGKKPELQLCHAVADFFRRRRAEAEPLGHHVQIVTQLELAVPEMVSDFAALKCRQHGIGDPPPGCRLPVLQLTDLAA